MEFRDAWIARWLRDDGALVTADEPICELETEEATVEFEAPETGILRRLAKAGDKVGTPEGDLKEFARIDPVPGNS